MMNAITQERIRVVESSTKGGSWPKSIYDKIVKTEKKFRK
jgi:hypothetical protein